MSQPKWITDRNPRSDETVMIRMNHGSHPVWPGFYLNGIWRSADGEAISNGAILGWMAMKDAAALLDGPSNAELAKSLK